MPCHELCETCTAKDVSDCIACKYYRQDGRCVHECDSDYFIDTSDHSTCLSCHPHCVQCWGPTPSNCVKCKHYTIYADLGIGEEEDDEGGDKEPLTVSDIHVYWFIAKLTECSYYRVHTVLEKSLKVLEFCF